MFAAGSGPAHCNDSELTGLDRLRMCEEIPLVTSECLPTPCPRPILGKQGRIHPPGWLSPTTGPRDTQDRTGLSRPKLVNGSSTDFGPAELTEETAGWYRDRQIRQVTELVPQEDHCS